MTLKAGDTYVCAECEGTFETDWDDDEARGEHRDNFGVAPEALAAEVVCDDCYQRLMRRLNG